MTTTVRCESCGGSGVRELSDTEVETMMALRSDWDSTSVIIGRIPVSIGLPALCNRLVKLLEQGLVERKRINGNRFAYRRAPGWTTQAPRLGPTPAGKRKAGGAP